MAGTILTNIGLSKLAAATPQNQLNITHIAVGDGNGGFPTLSPTMTALTNEVWRGAASNPVRSDEEENVIFFEVNIPPEDGGFTIREVAIFDNSGAMIAIGHTSEIAKPEPTSESAFSLTARIFIALENASQVSLIYQDTNKTHHNTLTNRDASNSHPATAIKSIDGRNVEQRLNDLPAEVSAFVTAEADRAETAADSIILLDKGPYDDIYQGIASTVDGDYFNVISQSNVGFLDLYKNENGVAQYNKTYPNSTYIDRIKSLALSTHTSTDYNFMQGIPIVGGSYYATGGTVESSPTWSRTEKFAVNPSSEYIFAGRLTSSRNIHLFDINGDYLRDARSKSTDVETYTFTTGSDVYFAGASLLDSQIPNQRFNLTVAQVSDDLVTPSDLELYQTKVDAETLDSDIKNILTPSKLNMLTPSEYVADEYYATGGTVESSPTWSRTPKIAVKRNTDYTYIGDLTSSRNIHLFNDSGDYIRDARTLSSTVDRFTFNTGEADFVGISILNSDIPNQSFTSKKDIVNNSIISSNAFDEIPHSQKGGTYKLFQAVVKNPLNISIDNQVTAININFDDGIAISENCLELVQYTDKTVPNSAMTGTVVIKDFTDAIPCQFSGDVNDNLRFDDREDGYYSSGFLKNGKLFFYTDFLALEEKVFYIKVYNAPVTNFKPLIDEIPATEAGEGFYLDAESPGGIDSFKLHFDGALTPLQMYVNGVSTYTGTRRLFYTSTIKGDGTTVVSMQPNTPQADPNYLYSSIRKQGSGIVFKDVAVEFVHNDHKNLKIIYRFRMFANGYLDIDATCKFIDEQDADNNLRVDQLLHNVQMNYDNVNDEVSAITPNINYIKEGHHRFAINKNAAYSFSGLISSHLTQSRPYFSQMSNNSTSSVTGSTLRLQAILKDLAADTLGAGAYTNTQIKTAFSGSVDNINADRYHYTTNQRKLLNKSYGVASSKKETGQTEGVKKSLSSIVDSVSRHIVSPSSEGYGSYAQFQLLSVLLGKNDYTISSILSNYEMMREQYRKPSLIIDYFESYFGLPLATAQANDNGTTYYPPYNANASDRPFATQKLGRDFHITRALIEYFSDENEKLQTKVDDAQSVIDDIGSSQALKDAMQLEIERYNLLITANNSKITEYKAEIKLLADACVYIELYNSRKQKADYDANSVDQAAFEPRGRVALQWKSSPIEPLNGSTTIMRFLNDAIELLPLDPNASAWQSAYNNLRYYVTYFLVETTNIIPYGYDRDVSIRNYLHYSTYTLYDLLNCEKPNDFSFTSQILDSTLSSGLALELSSATANRRGITNTYLYIASILSRSGSANDKELVQSVLSRVDNSCFTSNDDFSRTITINDWENNETLEQQDFDVTMAGTLLNILKIYIK